ncbi:MAG: hypothetical protein ACXVLB_17575 [Acidimicrobiales bacterium]
MDELLGALGDTSDAGRPVSDEAPARGPRATRAELVAIGLAAIVAAALVWWSTATWGPGLSPDAIAYTAIAERIRDHGQIGYWLEPRTSSWPPLFPLVLAGVATITGSSVVDAGRVVNSVVAGLIVVVVAALAWRLLSSTWLRGLAIAAAVLAQPLVAVEVKVWSEPVFVLFVLLTLLVLGGVPGRRPILRLLGAAALASAAFSTRYAGLAVLPAGVAALAVWPRQRPWRERAVHAAWFGVPAGAAAGGLLIWNRWRTGRAFGPRWRPHEPFWHHAADGLAAVGQWLLPTGSARGPAIGFGALVLVAAAGAVVAWPTSRPAPRGADRPSLVGPAPVLATFVGCYFAYMVYARTTSGFDPLSSRLMLPIFVPALLLVLLVAERVASASAHEPMRVLVLALPFVLVVPGLIRGVDALQESRDVGTQYTNGAVRSFVASPVLAQVTHDCQVITDDPWLLWLAGFEAQLSPESDREVAIPVSMRLDELAPLVAGGDVCLVWLQTGSSVFYTPDQLAQVVTLDRVAGDDFTTVYRLGSRS